MNYPIVLKTQKWRTSFSDAVNNRRNSITKRALIMELVALHISPTFAGEIFLTARNNKPSLFPHYIRNRHGRFQVKAGSRSWNLNKVSRRDLIQQVLERNCFIEDSQEKEEMSASGGESSFLSLSEKPDRNMTLLDDYELQELDFASPTNHRSGL